MNGKHPIVLGHRLQDIHVEINKLRRRDGHEEIGGLALARKLFSHFKEEHNPRVAEAFANLEREKQAKAAAPGQDLA